MDMDEKKYKILYFLDYGKSFGGAANTLFWFFASVVDGWSVVLVLVASGELWGAWS